MATSFKRGAEGIMPPHHATDISGFLEAGPLATGTTSDQSASIASTEHALRKMFVSASIWRGLSASRRGREFPFFRLADKWRASGTLSLLLLSPSRSHLLCDSFHPSFWFHRPLASSTRLILRITTSSYSIGVAVLVSAPITTPVRLLGRPYRSRVHSQPP